MRCMGSIPQSRNEQKCERGVPSRCCMQVCLQEAGLGGVVVEVIAASD